jgi:hypothetical protein
MLYSRNDPVDRCGRWKLGLCSTKNTQGIASKEFSLSIRRFENPVGIEQKSIAGCHAVAGVAVGGALEGSQNQAVSTTSTTLPWRSSSIGGWPAAEYRSSRDSESR